MQQKMAKILIKNILLAFLLQMCAMIQPNGPFISIITTTISTIVKGTISPIKRLKKLSENDLEFMAIFR